MGSCAGETEFSAPTRFQLAQCLSTLLPNGAERRPRLRWRFVERLRRDTSLNADQRDCMSKDVVELVRDPQALLLHPAPGLAFPVGLGTTQPLLHPPLPHPPSTQRLPLFFNEPPTTEIYTLSLHDLFRSP